MVPICVTAKLGVGEVLKLARQLGLAAAFALLQALLQLFSYQSSPTCRV
jgi:hypothetical protein